MTDITELAQSLKAAANKAGADDWQAKKISGDFYVIRKGSYSSQCGYRTYQPIAEIDHKSTRDYVAIASPANVLALVEALEKAQQFIARQGQILRHQDESLAIRRGELEFTRRRIAELEQKHCGGALMERELAHSQVINKLMSEVDNRDSRIAELEALKDKRLPNPYAYLRENDGQIQISIGAERPSDSSGGYATPWFPIYTAAGIKVEAE